MKEMEQPRKHLETDLGIAAYFLATNAVPFLGLERIGKGRYAFVFDGSRADMNRLVNDYFSDAPASAKSVVDAIRKLKDRLFAEKLKENDSNGCQGNKTNRS